MIKLMSEKSRITAQIKAQRWDASIASGGKSSDYIYEAFLKLVLEFELRGDMLDFGAGTANLLKRLKPLNRFDSITGIDIMPCPPDVDISEWICADLNNTINIADESFDVILSVEVLEHLENPRKIMREWFRLLRPEGILIFSTPNNESWRSLISLLLRGHFVAFSDACYPAHITALLRRDIERALKEAGFGPPVFRFTNVGSIPKLPQITWQMISYNFLKSVRFSDNLISISKKPCWI